MCIVAFYKDKASLLSKRVLDAEQQPVILRYVEEEQTTQWPKETEPKDKQRSTKHYTES
jgi:hypothetical protein